MLLSSLSAREITLSLAASATNPCKIYSLVNSVDFHPQLPLCSVTYTFCDSVVLYRKSGSRLKIAQTLKSHLSAPQHAVFTPDGKTLVVANWSSQTFTLYSGDEQGFFAAEPCAVIPTPETLAPFRFHGIAFSSCGKFLAVAYGAGSEYDRAIAVFHYDPSNYTLTLTSCLRGKKEVLGVPKGIAFSPDGKAILVTFSDLNALAIYDFSKTHAQIASKPRQIIQGGKTHIFRPEDIKLTPDGSLCAVSNSDAGSIAFFAFDPITNTIQSQTPIRLFDQDLTFPHGLSFSSDGSLFAVTQFGPIHSDDKGDIFWSHITSPSEAKVVIFNFAK